MKLRTFLIFSGCIISLVFLIGLWGCGGASLDYGQGRNMDIAKPNYTNPAWYDDYSKDPSAAAKKYKKKIFLVDVQITNFEESDQGIELKGATGEDDAYRIVCQFPLSASNRFQGLSPGERITVKGMFDHFEDVAGTSEIYLTTCLLVRN